MEFCLLSMNNWGASHFPVFLDEIVFMLVPLGYFYHYRRYNLLCFELMFLPIFFLCVFFDDIILSSIGYYTSGIGGALDNAVKQSSYVLKSRMIQMLGFLFFIGGSCWGSKLKHIDIKNSWYAILQKSNVDYRLILNTLAFLLLIQIVICYLDGSFKTWFGYENNLSGSNRNHGLGDINSLCFLSTLVVFSMLAKRNVHTFRAFCKNCNKLYLIEVLFISLLLIVSGNRNEMLLIFLPIIISYNIFVKKIPNKLIISGLFVGIFLMVYIGLTRQGDNLEMNKMDMFSITRDYSLVDINCRYLIKYTDEGSPHMFETLFTSVLSGVPFIGPQIINAMGWDMSTQSTYVTTAGMAQNKDTGLGTSLIGDLYYNAYSIFVVLFMFGFGYFMSRLYVKIYIEKKYKIGYLIIFIYMTANAAYYVRQQWDFPIHSMLYDFIILYFLFKLFKNKGNEVNKKIIPANPDL